MSHLNHVQTSIQEDEVFMDSHDQMVENNHDPSLTHETHEVSPLAYHVPYTEGMAEMYSGYETAFPWWENGPSLMPTAFVHQPSWDHVNWQHDPRHVSSGQSAGQQGGGHALMAPQPSGSTPGMNPVPVSPTGESYAMPYYAYGMVPPFWPYPYPTMPSDATIPGVPQTEEQMLAEQSYVENILRFNHGKMATFYLTYENNSEWNAKIIRGVIQTAGRDHIIVSDPDTGKRYLLLMVNLDYVVFDEPITYITPKVPSYVQMHLEERG